jgi:predicted glycoside hydrolase/deacetylase ChbG (UPF0249 family)
MIRGRKLIVNADDFGFSEETVGVTIDLFEKGLVTSASMMPGMPAFSKAAAFARRNPTHSYGLHLCLTDEVPLSSPKDIPSLVDETGRFCQTRNFWKRAFSGRIEPSEIEREVCAQLDALLGAGVDVTHVDGHGHVHKAPVVSGVLRRVMLRKRVLAVRRTQNLYLGGWELGALFNWLTRHGVARCGRTTDFFLMVTGRIEVDDLSWWKRAIAILPEGLTEIGIHPGILENWRQAETLPLLQDAGNSVLARDVRLVSYRALLEA